MIDVSVTRDVEKQVTVDAGKNERTRKMVHVGMSGVIILVVLLLKYVTDDSAIGLLMKFAGFTYGPLIGMFFFGILTRRSLNDKLVPFICLFSIVATFVLWYFSAGAPGVEKGAPGILGAYKFGFELIILNALITFTVLLGVSGSSAKIVKHEDSNP